MSDDRWRSPLGSRYASPAMQTLWGERHRIGLWRRLWLALAETERELGLDIPEQASAQMRGHLDDADLDVAARYERRFRHDVMAHIHAFGDQAPAARPFLHLGATSAFVTDNADLIVMRDGLRLLLGRLIAVLGALEQFATRYAGLPCLAYTHFQPAQLTTVGKRATLWMQDFAIDVEEAERVGSRRCGSGAARAQPARRPPSWSSSAAITTRCGSSTGGLRPSSGLTASFQLRGRPTPGRRIAPCSTR